MDNCINFHLLINKVTKQMIPQQHQTAEKPLDEHLRYVSDNYCSHK